MEAGILNFSMRIPQDSGNNMQRVKIGDIILIHDDGPCIHWKLAAIEKLSKGGEGVV